MGWWNASNQGEGEALGPLDEGGEALAVDAEVPDDPARRQFQFADVAAGDDFGGAAAGTPVAAADRAEAGMAEVKLDGHRHVGQAAPHRRRGGAEHDFLHEVAVAALQQREAAVLEEVETFTKKGAGEEVGGFCEQLGASPISIK